MYFKFACPSCNKSLKVGEDKAGQKARCPYCHATVVVPQPPQPLDGLAAESSHAVGDIPVAAPRRKESTVTSTIAAGTSGADTNRASANASAEGTNVGMIQTGGVAVGLTALFYVSLLTVVDSRLWDLFYERGWVTVAEALLFFWCISILFFKLRKLRRQKDSMLFDLLPNEISDDIAVRNVDQFAKHVRSLPVAPGESFIVNRVLRGLEHFAIRRSTPEVGTMLSSQSDIDANAVGSSYTLLKVFIWAIPILGFIGTVQGLGDAVGAFAGSMEGASDVAALKNSLGSIIGGLAVAFDTTLVALIMSVPLTYLTSQMQKSEEDLLNWVDEYTNENLLKRLNDGGGGGPSNIDNKQALRAAIDSAMADHHAELEAWRQKLESIGATLTGQVVEGWSSMLTDIRTVQEQLAKSHQEQLTDHTKSAAELTKAISGLAHRADTVQEETVKVMRDAASSVHSYFSGLEEALESLNRVLGDLGQKQVVIHVDGPRGWWPFGGRKPRQPNGS